MSGFSSVLLAAGAGTRLRPLTKVLPKPALPLLDVPLAAWGLADLTSLGRPVTVNLSHGHELVRDALRAAASRMNVVEPSFLIEEPEPFGSAGTIAALRDDIARGVVTRNADLLSDLSSRSLIASHVASGAPATIAVQSVARGADLVAENKRAIRLIDRRLQPDEPGELWLGAAVFERHVLDLIGDERPLDLARGLLAPLIERGDVALHHHGGYALDVGTPQRYLMASFDLLHRRGPAAPLPFPGEVVEVPGGLAYLGPGAQVNGTLGDGALGDGAIVLAGATVASGAHIKRCIVWPGETVPAGAQVSDAIWFDGRPWA